MLKLKSVAKLEIEITELYNRKLAFLTGAEMEIFKTNPVVQIVD